MQRYLLAATIYAEGTDPTFTLRKAKPAGASKLHRYDLNPRRQAASLEVIASLSQQTTIVAALPLDAEQIRLAGKVSFDAVICSNDQLARGCIDVLKSHGLRIPRDVVVMGHDNWEILVTASRPSLTCINNRLECIGKLTAQLLVDAIEGNPPVESPTSPAASTPSIHGGIGSKASAFSPLAAIPSPYIMGANHGLSNPIAVPHSNERNGCLETELHASSISLKLLCRASVTRATNRHCPLGVDRIGTKTAAVRGSDTREFVTAPHACVETSQST